MRSRLLPTALSTGLLFLSIIPLANAVVIGRLNLDGSGAEVLLSVLDERVGGIAIDRDQGKMYWTSLFGPPSGGFIPAGPIKRANLDGTAVETLVTLTGAEGIALDRSNGHMYWASPISGIGRANLDGTQVTDLGIPAGMPTGIALDEPPGFMYFTDDTNIKRANLDGSNVTDLVFTSEPAFAIDLDRDGNQIYWTSLGGNIWRSNFDGTNVVNLVTGLANGGISLDVATSVMYWTDDGNDKIQRGSLDGTNIVDLTTTVMGPVAIALDLEGGKIYFSADAIVPLPPAVYLFGSGLVGLIGIARRKKAA